MENQQLTYTVDSFSNGVAFGQHKLESEEDPRDYYALRLSDTTDVVKLRSRYTLSQKNPLEELEKHLSRLSKQGVLGTSTIYLGVGTDPFFPFEGRFDPSMRFLDIFMRYRPGLLVVQTRSPLIVIAMPLFRKLGQNVAVTIGIETPSEDAVARFTPGLPRVSERLKTATALRRFGVEVTLQVNPVLPYGDWKADAKGFAEILVNHADYIHIKPLTDGTVATEKKLRNTPVARKLAMDRKFHWLRGDSAVPLITEVEKLASTKLRVPVREHLKEKQMKIFAA